MSICSFLLLCLLAGQSFTFPRFEVYWESQASYMYNEDELHNPWYIDLGAIDVGAPGYIGGPNTVTIHAADYCVQNCQEDYPDEFCSQYPPEGVPAKPRTVDDWGTKFNITAAMMKEGIARIHQKGGKVHLAYSDLYSGIAAENGGGSKNIIEDYMAAHKLADRIARNVRYWDWMGLTFFSLAVQVVSTGVGMSLVTIFLLAVVQSSTLQSSRPSARPSYPFLHLLSAYHTPQPMEWISSPSPVATTPNMQTL